MASVTVVPGTPSNDIAVTRNAVFSVTSDKPVQVYAKNAANGEYYPLAVPQLGNGAVPYIACSDAVQLRAFALTGTATVDIG